MILNAGSAQKTPEITVSSDGLITAAAGPKSATKQLATQAGKTVTPGTSQQTAVVSQRYTTGPVYVAGDANLVSGNIKSGVSIFGVAGSYAGGKKVAAVTGVSEYNNTEGYLKFTLDQSLSAVEAIYITGMYISGGSLDDYIGDGPDSAEQPELFTWVKNSYMSLFYDTMPDRDISKGQANDTGVTYTLYGNYITAKTVENDSGCTLPDASVIEYLSGYVIGT